MNRREILKYTAYLSGASLGAPLLTSLLSGCNPEATADSPANGLRFFQPDEFDQLRQLVDIILPKTESPAASEVGVHNMIDAMVGKTYTKEQQAEYQKGFRALLNHLEKKEDLLSSLQDLEDPSTTNLPEVRQAYLHLKQQSIAYYLSTEEIGKNYLNYLPVPGEYQACIELSDVGGKAWAL